MTKHSDNDLLKKTAEFEKIRNDYNLSVAENEENLLEINELKKTVEILHEKLEKYEAEEEEHLAKKVKAVNDEKKSLQLKHELNCQNMKRLKTENEDYKKEIDKINVALKTTKKAKNTSQLFLKRKLIL